MKNIYSWREEEICPECGEKYTGYPAISRIDNKTAICSNCGVREALMASVGFEMYKRKIGGR